VDWQHLKVQENVEEVRCGWTQSNTGMQQQQLLLSQVCKQYSNWQQHEQQWPIQRCKQTSKGTTATAAVGIPCHMLCGLLQLAAAQAHMHLQQLSAAAQHAAAYWGKNTHQS
jgi:hypothetical protein